MPSPKAKNPSRGSGSPVLGSSGGRCDFAPLTKPLNRPSPQSHLLQRQGSDPTTARLRASESPTRRRGSSSSTGSTSGQGLSEEDGIRLNPTFLGVALSSLLAVDLWLSKRMGVCACEDSSWGSVRPLMKLIEISGHGVPWLAGTVYCLYKSDTVAGQEVMLNLLIGKPGSTFPPTDVWAASVSCRATLPLITLLWIYSVRHRVQQVHTCAFNLNVIVADCTCPHSFHSAWPGSPSLRLVTLLRSWLTVAQK